MSGRRFALGTFAFDGQPSACSLIECARCRVVGRYRHVGRRKPPEAIEQYFRNHGWEVGKSPRGDVCPACANPAKLPKETVMTAAAEPRAMSREDRRIIFAKVDELYLDDKSGYTPPWTDNAVARDLGVPRAWVATVRDELFGPEGSNAEFDDFIAKAAPIITDLKNLHKSVAAQLEEARKLSARVEDLERVAKRVEREIGKASS